MAEGHSPLGAIGKIRLSEILKLLRIGEGFRVGRLTDSRVSYVPYSQITLQTVKFFDGPYEAQLLLVIESTFVERVNPASFLTAVLQGQESEPDILRYVAVGTNSTDQAATFSYFCQGSKIRSSEVA